MNGLPYYRAYPRDFIEGTIGMPFEVKCAYRVVIDLIYMQGGNLPDDPRYISGLLGCTIRKWKSIRQALIDAGKLDVSSEFLTNNRAEKELETLGKLQEKQSENASGPRKNNGLEKPSLNHTEPEPEPEEEKTKSDLGDEFDSWYGAYPRRVGRGQAEKAYRAARKKTDAATLIEGAHVASRRYRDSDPRFIPHPATWLNGERWLDEAPSSSAPVHRVPVAI